MREEVIQAILDNKIIAIVRGIEPKLAVRVAEALYEGGIKLIEITFNQSDNDSFVETANAIQALKTSMAGKMHVGAGTVLTEEQLELAYRAGAEFIISPDSDENVIRKTREKGLVSIPGAYTGTEIKKASVAGADFVKIFPCMSAIWWICRISPWRSPMITMVRAMRPGVASIKKRFQFSHCGRSSSR